MLARTAQGIYWMSRYLERTQYLCHLLRLQSEALVDRPIREIHFGWSRIYDSIGRQPPAGSIMLLDSDNYTLADSYTLADDFTFERTNPDSIWNCFTQGRENARQMRQCLSAEMWASLNLAYLRVRELSMEDIWRSSPENFYTWMAGEIDTFAGVAAATMYRDEGWHFMRLGNFIERAQLLSALLITQLDLDETGEDHSAADWISLLRMYHAVEAYNHRYNVEVEPEKVVDELATDGLLAGSLIRSLDRAGHEIRAIGVGPDGSATDATRRLAGRLSSMLHYEWPDRTDKRAMLVQVNGYCRDLHQSVSDTFFDYSSSEMLRS